jgi:Lrp/AsnC family transcriptional regulator for asnA, asnC and gidA
VFLTTGQWDVMMRVYAADADNLRELMFDTVTQMDGFARSQTMVILGTRYETEELPV